MADVISIRKDMRRAVRGIVNKDEFYEAVQLKLEETARSSGFADCLRKCMEEGGNVKACYATCAAEKKISEAYRAVWGKK